MDYVTKVLPTVAALLSAGGLLADDFSGNVGINNNYLWRGLTQTENEPGISGGLDYSADSGLYAGTWVSNVSFGAGDVFSYEHDLYIGYSGGDTLGWDIGWLYYNYDSAANIDFSELYGSLAYGGFTLAANLLVHTEADEPTPAQDFGFGEAFYVALDWAVEIRDGLELGVHVGRHNGDFNEFFNGVPGAYTDFNISLSKNDFTFMISDTNLDDAGPGDIFDNDEIKFVVSYSMSFDL